MRQTCGQRSSMCMGSKRWALEFFFNEQISHMFLILKCREARDVGLCTFWVLAYRKPLRNAKFRFFLRAKHICFRKSPWHNFSLYANTQKHTDLDLKILYILILGTYNKLARKNNFLARLSVCFLQPRLCSSAGRRLATSFRILFTLLSTNRFNDEFNFSLNEKPCSTENPRSFEKFPTPP